MADRSERKERLVAALSDMFCTHGYGGASVAVLVRAAGLSKASLYHHFPGGKEARLEVGMLAPLAGDTPLPERVDAMMAAVEEHHGGGCEPGIFGQFSQVGTDHP
jgi:AcrR family transcriptional regulator